MKKVMRNESAGAFCGDGITRFITIAAREKAQSSPFFIAVHANDQSPAVRCCCGADAVPQPTYSEVVGSGAS